MKTLQDIIAEVQALLADLQALATVPAGAPLADPVVSIEATTESGTTEKFLPSA